MTDASRHDEIRELLVPYSLGELHGDACLLIEAALDADPTLRTELDQIEAVQAGLMSGVVRRSAPLALKGRIMDAVGAASKPHSAPVSQQKTLPSLTAYRERRRRFLMPSIAGALAAACSVLALVSISLDGDLDQTRDELRTAEDTAKAASQNPSPELFAGSETHKVSTSEGFSQAKGTLIKLRGGKYLLALENIPNPGIGKSWQVWTVDSSKQIRNVAQWATANDSQLLVIDKADIVEVMVSFEPTTRPVPTPSSAPVADVLLQA